MLQSKAAYKFITDILLPNRCAFCGRVIVWNRLVCDDCESSLPFLEDTKIKVEGAKRCYSCFKYQGQVMSLIKQLKVSGEVNNFAEYSAKKVCQKICADFCDGEIDIVTAVPMHFSKRLRRGYNQAGLFADFIADMLHKPTDYTLLARSDDSLEQHRMTRRQRAEHAEAIYSVAKGHNDIKGRNILICDDVITTGATMRVCARKLKEIGANRIFCCSAAFTPLDKNKKPKTIAEEA